MRTITLIKNLTTNSVCAISLKVAFVMMLFIVGMPAFGQVVISADTDAVANPSSILDVQDTAKGLLIPRMTQAQRLAMNPLPAPAQGLTVYQTDSIQGYYFNTSTTTSPTWVYVFSSASGGWSTTGNTGLVDGTNFIGNIDSLDWTVRTNNRERLRVSGNGNVGIGTSSPQLKFHVDGTGNLARFGNGITTATNNFWYTGNDFGSFVEQVGNTTTSGSDRLRIQSSKSGNLIDYSQFFVDPNKGFSFLSNGTANGNVGIGTASPFTKLHIVRNGISGATANSNALAVFENNSSGYLHLLTPTAGENGILFGNPSGSIRSGIIFNSGIKDGLDFRTGGNNARMAIDSTGNVRIATNISLGINGPLIQKLEVLGSNSAASASGTSTDGIARFKPSNGNIVLDVGAFNLANPQHGWIQVRDRTSYATNYSLALNPNGGNVGIGTTIPLMSLQIGGAGGYGLQKGDVSPNAGYLRFGDNTGWKFHIGRLSEASGGAVNTNTTGTLLTVQDNGNVGIGTVTPVQKLEINGLNSAAGTSGTAADGIARFKPTNGNIVLDIGAINTSSPQHGWIQVRDKTNYTSNLSLALNPNGGNVGIGTTSPGAKLHVKGVGNTSATSSLSVQSANASQILLVRDDGRVAIGGSFPASLFHVGGDLTVGRNANAADVGDVQITTWTGASPVFPLANRLLFGTDNQEWQFRIASNERGTIRDIMTFTRTGSVGIGVTAPTLKFEVAGAGKFSGQVIGGAGVFSGTVTASCGTLTCSDIRYKKFVTPLAHCLEKINQLNGVSYFWKKEEFPEKNFTDAKQIGVIAQELEKVYPELVTTDDKGYKTVDYSKLTPILLEAIKELNNRNDQLNSEVKNLKSGYSELQSSNAQMENDLQKIKQLLGIKAEANGEQKDNNK